jgi:hypothetical protein
MRYFAITYIRKPNGQVDEQALVTKSLNNSDLQTCNVILDFKEKKIIKASIDGNILGTDWAKLIEYYKKVYPDNIEALEKDNQ